MNCKILWMYDPVAQTEQEKNVKSMAAIILGRVWRFVTSKKCQTFEVRRKRNQIICCEESVIILMGISNFSMKK